MPRPLLTHQRLPALPLVLCALMPAVVGAASLQVSPTTLELHARQTAEALWLSNSGTEPVQVQVRVYRWSQINGKDDLQPTHEMVVSPPMQQLAAGQRQLLRVVRSNGEAPVTQQTYRIIVDEIPTYDPERSGMQLVLRYSIPVFLLPDGSPPQPQLQARLLTDPQGDAALEISNRGDGHAQIADLAYGAPGHPLIVRPGLVGYVLPGQTMRWPLEHPPSQFKDGGFSARINGEPEQTPLSTAPTAR